MSSFADFLNSPYFNRKKQLTRFFGYLSKFYPGFDDKKLEKEFVYKKIFPKSRFNGQVFKNLCSELYSHAKEFITIDSYKKKTYRHQINFIEILEKKRIDELYLTELKSLEKELKNSPYYERLFMDKFETEGLKINYHLNRSRQKDSMYHGINEGTELLKFFIVNATRILFGFTINRAIFNAKFSDNAFEIFTKGIIEKGMLDTAINFIETNKINDWEIVTINYYLILALLYPGNDEYYEKAKGLVFNNINKFSREHQFEIPNALFTICTRRINVLHTRENYNRAFELVQFQLSNNLFKTFNESFITVYKFRNVFMIALSLRKYKWIKEFTEKYIKEVTPVDRENLWNHCNAFIAFNNNDYKRSIDYLNKVKFDQFIYKIDVKNLLLLNYYELGYFENARSLITSFRQFLKTNKFVSSQFAESNNRLIKRYETLLDLTDSYDEIKLDLLRKDIIESPYMIYGDWFLKVLDRIKKQR